MKSKSVFSTEKLTYMGVLLAILIIFAFTPLGYLRIGFVNITFNMIPVIIGAIIVGPSGGAVLGLAFGLTSFAQAFGADPLGTALLQVNPFYMFIMCVVPRVLAGFLPGLTFKWMKKARTPYAVAVPVTAFIGSALNTLLFVTALWAFWHNAAPFTELFGKGMSLLGLFAVIITTNAIIEAIVNISVGVGVSSVIKYFSPFKK